MRKLNLENVQEVTPFETVKAGGYICGICNVEDVPLDKNTGKGDYLKIFYDIIEGEHKGYYTKLQKEKGWSLPNFIKSYKSENSLPYFKAMVTAFEKSNPNFKWRDNEKDLIGKKVGLVLGEEEYINSQGKKKVRMYVDNVHSIDRIKKGDFNVPELITVDTAQTSTNTNPFANAQNPFANTNNETTVKSAQSPSVSFFDNDDDDDDENNPF